MLIDMQLPEVNRLSVTAPYTSNIKYHPISAMTYRCTRMKRNIIRFLLIRSFVF